MLRGLKLTLAGAAIAFAGFSGAAQASSVGATDTLLNWTLTQANDRVEVIVNPFASIVELDPTVISGGVAASPPSIFYTGPGSTTVAGSWGPGTGAGSTTDGALGVVDYHGLIIAPGVSLRNLQVGFAGAAGSWTSLVMDLMDSTLTTVLATVSWAPGSLNPEVTNFVATAGEYIVRITGVAAAGVDGSLPQYEAIVMATPIPPAFLLFLSGIVGLVAVGRRRRAATAAA